MSIPERLHDRSSRTVPAPAGVRGDVAVAAALGTALAYGALDQGGFYRDQFTTVLGLVALALLARALAGPRRMPGWLAACVAAWSGFAGWALLGAAGHGSVEAGLPAAAVAGCLAAAAWCAAGLGGPGRRLLAAVVVAVGLLVAGTGWFGVALHRPPLALPSAQLWRSASTLTYANSSAALLVVAILVALVTLPTARRLASTLILALLLLGLATTMSRAGALGLLLGLAVACAAPALRRRLVDSWPAVPGAAVGFAGLLPSLPVTAAPNPLLALAGLAAGAGLIVVMERRPRWSWPVLAAGTAAWLLAAPATLGVISASRLTAASPERADLVRVALAQFRSAPLTGVGPGGLDLAYVDHAGVPVLARFVHQEYLQVATETGLIGLALVLAGAVALALGALRSGSLRFAEPVRRGRPLEPGPAVALAVLAAFAAHSAFDYLWHIPLLPLLVVLVVVALIPVQHDNCEKENP